MVRKVILMAAIAAGALMLGACASQGAGNPAATPAVAQAAPAPASQQKGQQMVCTSGTPVGSHIARTTCMTAAQYKQIQQAHKSDQDAAQKMMNMSQKPCPAGSSLSGC